MELNNEHDDRISVSSNNNESFHSRVDSFTSDSRHGTLWMSWCWRNELVLWDRGRSAHTVRHGLCSAHT